jgi:hypothetical protein
MIDLAEARKARRSRVIDFGLIKFGDISVACVIRNLSEDGAAIDVGPQSGIPNHFTLFVMSRRKFYSCRIVWRSDRRIGISFH